MFFTIDETNTGSYLRDQLEALEAPLPVWANFRQRALDVAIAEINQKTDLKIKLASVERSKHRRVVALNFTIKTQAVPKRRTEP